ncbi:MAG: hypothetical protein IJ729_04880 [Alloprevotella sp.]|nr:hypothetical protein [Alloprevotella sp.]
MTIAVDFDGTVVEHRYPAIGKERPFATATLRRLMEDGHKLIFWSCREGELLQQAIDWCAERGVRFYAVNADLNEDKGESIDTLAENPGFSRKLKVDIFIDDRNVGGLPDWGAIYQIISNRITYEQYLTEGGYPHSEQPPKKPWWKF